MQLHFSIDIYNNTYVIYRPVNINAHISNYFKNSLWLTMLNLQQCYAFSYKIKFYRNLQNLEKYQRSFTELHKRNSGLSSYRREKTNCCKHVLKYGFKMFRFSSNSIFFLLYHFYVCVFKMYSYFGFFFLVSSTSYENSTKLAI